MRAEILETVNSLHTEEPLRIPLPYSDNSPMLCPGANFEFSLQLHVDSVGEQDLCLLFVYREACVSRMVLNGFYLASSYRTVQSYSRPLSSVDTSQYILFLRLPQQHNPATLPIIYSFSIWKFGISLHPQW